MVRIRFRDFRMYSFNCDKRDNAIHKNEAQQIKHLKLDVGLDFLVTIIDFLFCQHYTLQYQEPTFPNKISNLSVTEDVQTGKNVKELRI